MKYVFKLSAFIFFLFLFACNGKKATVSENNQSTEQFIELSEEQFEKAGMVLGEPQVHLFNDVVNATGSVRTAVYGITQISVYVPGKIKALNCANGDFVKKGSLLFKLEGNEILQLQQQYAQNSAALELAELNYERQKLLYADRISAQKELLMAKSEYNSLKSMNESLKKQLELLNFNPAEITQGKFTSSYSVLAPFSGVVSEHKIVNGQYLEPQELALELIDPTKFQLHLNLFEKDALSVAVGQKVLFYSPDNKTKIFSAEVSLIGKTIDVDTKTIQCIATIQQKDMPLLFNQMYVESKIVTCERESLAIPTEAIIKENDKHYVLVKNSNNNSLLQFKKVAVEIGREELEYTEILTKGLNDVLLKGVYNLSISE